MNNGFTFIEAIFTVLIFTVGILGVFLVAQYPIVYLGTINDRLTASFLAQEGVEIVRNIRDENWINETNPAWNNGLTNCEEINGEEINGHCEVDYNDVSLSSPYNNSFLKIDANGFYNQDSGADTKFKRRITITPKTDGQGNDYLEVIALVTWQEKGLSHNIAVQDNLYPWWGED